MIVLDTKQFDKKTHALSSSTVNVVCAKVTATTTTTQDMWDRMNNVSKRRSIDAYDRTYTDENNHPYRHDTSEEEEEEEDEADTRHEHPQDDSQEDSDLDITGSDNESILSVEQTQTVKSNSSNLFQFHFEFGSKRPPRTTVQQDVEEESDVQEATDVEEEEDPHSFLSSEQQDSDSERSLFDSASSSNDEDGEEEDRWSSKSKIYCLVITRFQFLYALALSHTHIPYLTLHYSPYIL